MDAAVAISPLPAKRLDLFERYLSLWVLVCMVAGILVGKSAPETIDRLSHWEFLSGSQVNAPIAILIWLMIYPMVLKIDFGGLKGVAQRPKGLFVTLFVNWLIKPFSMAFLGWLFVQVLFSHALGWIDPETARNYTAGLIILAAAPCTAMVFVWSYLTDGDGPYTLAQVAMNDLIMIFAFAPIVAILAGVNGVPIPFKVLLVSVLVFIVIPLLAGWLSRAFLIRKKGRVWFERQFLPFFRR
jgi:arsenite transporter